MRRFVKRIGLAGAAVVLGVFLHAGTARAQYVQVYSPPVVVAPAPVVSYYAPSYYAAPVTSYYAPSATYSYYPPTTVYAAPPATVSYYAPTTVYAAPPATVSYYAPAAVSYYTPTTVYPAPVTTRSYVGYGIFRPRGVYTESYYGR